MQTIASARENFKPANPVFTGHHSDDYRAGRFPSDLWKQIGILRDTLKVLLDDGAKFGPQSLALSFITPNRVVVFSQNACCLLIRGQPGTLLTMRSPYTAVIRRNEK